MAGNNWLAHAEMAAERILDAAGELFARHGPESIGMREIATAAGCSRATLYRYFDSRDALYTAYVHREARTMYGHLTEHLAGVSDPAERLISGITAALALVRQSPALAAWFTRSGPPIGAQMADRSEVITAMVAAFIGTMDAEAPQAPQTAQTAQRRARWTVRVMTSLLNFPGRDESDERAMLEEFLAPVVLAHATPDPGLSRAPGSAGATARTAER